MSNLNNKFQIFKKNRSGDIVIRRNYETNRQKNKLSDPYQTFHLFILAYRLIYLYQFILRPHRSEDIVIRRINFEMNELPVPNQKFRTSTA